MHENLLVTFFHPYWNSGYCVCSPAVPLSDENVLTARRLGFNFPWMQTVRPLDNMARSSLYDDYRIGVICALPLERTAVECMLDSRHDALPKLSGDNNTYSYGTIGKHNVVVASLGAGAYGTVSASGVANDMRHAFKFIKFGFMVGIAGGIPRPNAEGGDIRLGDKVVGCANDVPSIINYRLGKETSTGFDIRSELAEPPMEI